MGLCSIAAPRGPPAGTALTPNPSRGPSCPQVSLRAGTLRAFPRTRGRGDARPAHPLLQPRGAARLVGTGGAEIRGGRGAVPAARRDRDPPPPNTPGPRAWSRRSRSSEAPSRGWAAAPGAAPPFRGAGDAARRTEPHIRPPLPPHPPRADSQQRVSVNRGSVEQLSSASSSLWAPPC